MLTELRIINFAIIDHLEFDFDSGLIMFTGETGAGKSIIIDAVETVLGGRADLTMIRSGADRALIEATFQASESSSKLIKEILAKENLLDDSETLILAREVRRTGKNIARINGRTVSTSLLNELGQHLVDVHGQSEHLSLLRVRQHLSLLDSFANVHDILTAYSKTYHRLMSIREELTKLRQAESDAARRTDILKYQINEIESARLRDGEEEELKDEHTRLANAEGLRDLLQQALQTLDEGTPESPSVLDLMGQAIHTLHSITRIDSSRTPLSEQGQLVFDNLTELGKSLRNYQESIEFNPNRLNQVEERLNLLHNLKRKYGGSIPAILEYLHKSHADLDSITHVGERIEQLEAEETILLKQLAMQGQALSTKRQSAAQTLSRAVELELADLSMSGAQFQVQFHQRPDPHGVLLEDGRRIAFDSTGFERVEFLVAPNPGEGLKPLVKIASGGQTSRLMLAIKNVLVRADQVPTLVFDEIDQGIGGRVGIAVGHKLRNLSRQHQVICITHLPQLAAFGAQHVRVQKQIVEGRTITTAESIHGEERLLELAQMMGEISDGTRQSAKELLKVANTPIQ